MNGTTTGNMPPNHQYVGQSVITTNQAPAISAVYQTPSGVPANAVYVNQQQHQPPNPNEYPPVH